MRRRVSNWRLEIALVGLLVLALFLLLEQWDIRGALWRGIMGLLAVSESALSAIANALLSRTVSDLLGLVLIVMVAMIARWRVRWRIQQSPALTAKVCPRCGGELRRIHRRRSDKVLSWLLAPAHRYTCNNKQCGWIGLRYDSGKRKGTASDPEQSQS